LACARLSAARCGLDNSVTPAAPKVLQIKARPNARTSSLVQQEDGTWIASLKSPPAEGKANLELIALVAAEFRCPKSAVSIKSGAAARTKRVIIRAG
jgi:uncharacterized protein YggU (UPF0235/DUF167 family)